MSSVSRSREFLIRCRIELPRQLIVKPGDLQEAPLESGPIDLDSALADLEGASPVVSCSGLGIVLPRFGSVFHLSSIIAQALPSS